VLHRGLSLLGRSVSGARTVTAPPGWAPVSDFLTTTRPQFPPSWVLSSRARSSLSGRGAIRKPSSTPNCLAQLNIFFSPGQLGARTKAFSQRPLFGLSIQTQPRAAVPPLPAANCGHAHSYLGRACMLVGPSIRPEMRSQYVVWRRASSCARRSPMSIEHGCQPARTGQAVLVHHTATASGSDVRELSGFCCSTLSTRAEARVGRNPTPHFMARKSGMYALHLAVLSSYVADTLHMPLYASTVSCTSFLVCLPFGPCSVSTMFHL
jgi:hypothetical protein